MAERYNIAYQDVTGIDFEVSIYKDSYAGASTSLKGDAIYGMNSLDSMSEPIRSKFLQLNLLADSTNQLSDLLDAEEREWSVTLTRNTNVIFFGYLTSEGVRQSYVTMERYITFNVLDPMAFLEDLAYTDNTGNPYTGFDQLINIIAKCLQRSFEPLPTSAWFNQIKAYVPYDTWQNPVSGGSSIYTGGDFLKQHTLDQDQWIDEESGDEVKSCIDVLKEILFSLQLVIQQVNGDSWVIYHYLYDVSGIDTKYISYYDYQGNTIPTFTLNPFATTPILTDSVANQGGLIHCNENQSYFYKRGLKKLLLEQEFVYLKDIIENSTFDGGVTGVSMPSWSVGGDYSQARDNGTIRIYSYDTGVNPLALAAFSAGTPEINVSARQEVKIVSTIKAVGFDDAVFKFNVKIDTGVGDPYYLAWVPGENGISTGTWSRFTTEPSNNPGIPIALRDEVLSIEYLLPTPMPEGVITIRLYAASWGSTQPTYGTGVYIEVDDINIVNADINRTGTSYVIEMDGDNSLRSERKDIFVGTWLYNSIANNLRRLSSGDPISLIIDQSAGLGARELGEVVGINYLYSNRRRIMFSGDVFGFIEPITYMSIPDLTTNDFVILGYSYDTHNNVVSLELEERVNSPASTTEVIEPIYQNVIEPTIKS